MGPAVSTMLAPEKCVTPTPSLSTVFVRVSPVAPADGALRVGRDPEDSEDDPHWHVSSGDDDKLAAALASGTDVNMRVRVARRPNSTPYSATSVCVSRQPRALHTE